VDLFPVKYFQVLRTGGTVQEFTGNQNPATLMLQRGAANREYELLSDGSAARISSARKWGVLKAQLGFEFCSQELRDFLAGLADGYEEVDLKVYPHLTPERYWTCRVDGLEDSWILGMVPQEYDVTLGLTALDPYAYATDAQSETLALVHSTPQVLTLANAGSNPTPLVITAAMLLGTLHTMSIQVVATGYPTKTLTWTGTNPGAGSSLVIDTAAHTITKDGVDDSANFSGTWVHLWPGSNVVTISYGNSYSPGFDLTIAYRERWL